MVSPSLIVSSNDIKFIELIKKGREAREEKIRELFFPLLSDSIDLLIHKNNDQAFVNFLSPNKTSLAKVNPYLFL